VVKRKCVARMKKENKKELWNDKQLRSTRRGNLRKQVYYRDKYDIK
jgi:hypothetical protein